MYQQKIRTIPANVRVDAKLLKLIPVESLAYAGGVMMLGIMLWYLLKMDTFKGILTILVPPIATLVVFIYDVPGELARRFSFAVAKSTVKSMSDICAIKAREDDEVVLNTRKHRKRVYLEKKVFPWEVCTAQIRDKRADTFAQEVFKAVKTLKDGICVSLHGVCAPESTSTLEERLKSVGTLAPGIAALENGRIETHFAISRNASATRYFLCVEGNENAEEDIFDTVNIFEGAELIGSDTVQELAGVHLTIGSKLKRGKLQDVKDGRINVERDYLKIEDMYVKTLLISDFPAEAVAGVLGIITNGEHVKQGIVINFSIHFRPSTLKFNRAMNNRLKRLKLNIKSLDTGEITDTAREEEVKALKSLLYLRDEVDRYIDVWMTLTFSSPDLKTLNSSVKTFKDNNEFKGWVVNELINEQHIVLEAAWMGGGGNRIFSRYPGRVMDINAVAALYPFLNGSISDSSGCYIGHRISDCTAVYKSFTSNPGNQTMIVVGSSDAGKSTFIKGLVVSLLEAGFKVYIFDVDGEYFNLCRAVGGTWVNYTAGTGLYVDPTIIELPILKEIDSDTLDEESLERARESDMSRYNEAVSSTRAVISLLSHNFDVTIKKQNALGLALTQMWEDAGIRKSDPETWGIRSPKVSLHELYHRIKRNGDEGDIGASELAEDLWTYFEGPDSDLFAKSASSDWIKDSNLVVFHVASSADNATDQQMGAVKIVSVTHMTWQQIKRDRIKKQRYSAEIFDEWQRLRKNPHAMAPVYRSVTTGRKFNDQAILGFNDPSVIESEDGGRGIWDNSKYKIFFSLEENSIRKIAGSANMPDEVLNKWLHLPQYSFIFRQRAGGQDIYDILRMELPTSELNRVSKTRGLD